ncbi:unnamed protein product [Spodoptera littoralis]|uniref:Uncharacterized protein n=1 Tax=Spodoptera littoralis TaxID=7109 RepID=A0A9P0IJU0_SPOLI|nr:unnamed protein product [Spodoptera littoralis]CAH1647104.1 unnamed protein product [Spodoptera littoralis]
MMMMISQSNIKSSKHIRRTLTLQSL